MSERPAEIAGLADQGRPLATGEPANIAVIDPNAAWTVDPEGLASLSHNTPYAGTEFGASVTATVLRGAVTHNAGAHASGSGTGTGTRTGEDAR